MADERTTLKRAIDKYLKGLRRLGAPVWFVKLAGSMWQRVGLPDYIGCIRGRFVAVELKHPTDKKSNLSNIQSHVAGLIRKAGGSVSVVRSVEAFDEAVREWLENGV